MKIAVFLTILVLLTLLTVAGWKLSRFAYETPEYTLIRQEGAFEIREYPDLTVVATAMEERNPQNDGAFMRLFRYITRENEGETKIAMTTPVFMTGGERPAMSFVVPREVAESGVPVPTSSRIEVRTMEGSRVAVYRYSGNWAEGTREEARRKLADWVEEKALKTRGDYFSAGYDAPFIPGPLRRNEILIRIAAPSPEDE